MNGPLHEQVLCVDCAGERLPAIVSEGPASGDTGLVIVVGGPQYRVGSHRQFVQVARAVAACGFVAMRFDVRGMGDAPGEARSFEELDNDLGAAIDALMAARPSLRRVVLYGLCDGASAALMYCQRTGDKRVAGLCLLNPWLRSPQTLARTQVRHYYMQRLAQREFWTKLLRGGVAFQAVSGLLASVRSAAVRTPAAGADFRQLMAGGWRACAGPVLLLMSGKDLTAKEFDVGSASDAAWFEAFGRPDYRRIDFPDADHTFSRSPDRAAMEHAVVTWLQQHFNRPSLAAAGSHRSEVTHAQFS